jgi:acyl-coenzyme A synthetase/AMP-(fatty) acid ligase
MLSVIAGIAAARQRNAYAPALITDSRVVSYGDLEALIARVSNHLADRGLAPRTRVFINAGDADLRMVIMLAAMHAGMIPFAVLQQGDKDDLGPHIVVGSGAPQEPGLAADLTLDQAVLSGPAGDPVLRDFPVRDDGEILYVSSTTGTTGLRKLVAVLHGAWNRPNSGGGLFRFGPGQRIMGTFGDVTAIGVRIVQRLLMSGATHVRHPREADRCVRLINFLGVTELLTTPSTASDLVDLMERNGARCPSVTRILLTGSLFQKRLIERIEQYFDAEIIVAYGSTEVHGIAFGPVTSKTFEVGYVGELMPGVAVIDPGSKDKPAPVIIARAEGAMAPYYSRGNLVPPPKGPVTLPDIGYMRSKSLFLLGRSDEVFNASGNKTAFSIIEHDLLAQPGVADVGIVGGSAIGEPGGLVVVVAGAPDVALDALKARVIAAAKAKSAESHIHVVRVAAVPRNTMGKVDREAIVRAYQQARART